MTKPFSRFQHGSMNTLSSNERIGDEELMAFAPQIFQANKHEGRGESYVHIDTAIIHSEMTKAGFYPVKVIKQKARVLLDTDEGRAEAAARESFMKHMIMYRHPDALNPMERQGFGQVGYVGDHAGRCSIQMFAGWLEVLCGNGLIAGKVAEAIRLRHLRIDVMDVINSAFKMMEAINVVSEWRERLQAIPMTLETSFLMAEESLGLRWEKGKAPVYASQLLARRREGDRYDNLWGAYQLIEENLRRGGQRPFAALDRYNTASKAEQKLLPRPKTVAPIKALDTTLKFEVAVSDLADEWSKKIAA